MKVVGPPTPLLSGQDQQHPDNKADARRDNKGGQWLCPRVSNDVFRDLLDSTFTVICHLLLDVGTGALESSRDCFVWRTRLRGSRRFAGRLDSRGWPATVDGVGLALHFISLLVFKLIRT